MTLNYSTKTPIDALEDGDVDVLLNFVNCRGTVKAGAAVSIYDKYPSLFESYLDFCSARDETDLLGEYIPAYLSDRGIVHLIVERGSGAYGNTEYGALATSLMDYEGHTWATDTGNLNIGVIKDSIPKADWDVAESMIRWFLEGHNITVYGYED